MKIVATGGWGDNSQSTIKTVSSICVSPSAYLLAHLFVAEVFNVFTQSLNVAENEKEGS
jgi:hypothetical protein